MNRERRIYERVVRSFLFSLDPENAHHAAIGLLRATSRIAPALLRRFQPPPKPRMVFGVTFPNPIGLAAGFDKNGVAIPALATLGFGFIEIGTVTARAQPGNPRPRIFRFPQQQALINSLGFNNDGADKIAERLGRLRKSGRWPAIPVGINIGKSKTTAPEEATTDYLYSFRKLSEFADYIVLNVSSPNTPGLRELQGRVALLQLLRRIEEDNRTAGKPILIKIAPDLFATQLEEILAVCEEANVSGIIATNTTLDHVSIPPELDRPGGLSGVPLREKSTALLRAIRTRSKIPVIASGGVFDAESAREKFEAGAELVQVYTGFIYRGPGLLREIAG
jgi:dihydroorotate dehydrogenase